MIALSPSDAVDLMNSQFKARFEQPATATLIGYAPAMYWAGVEKAAKPDFTKYFVRVSHQTVLERQANLSNCEGVAGNKRFRTAGLTFVELYCPLGAKNVAVVGLKLATICRNAFRGTYQHTGDDVVWFYNARINRIGQQDESYRLNVIAEHEYDELG